MGDKIPWEIQGAKYMYLFDQAGIGRWIRAEGKQCEEITFRMLHPHLAP